MQIIKIKEQISGIIRHPQFKKYSSNIGWLVSEKILRLISGLFIGVWMARYLGPTQFGLYNYVISYVFLFGAVASLGIDSIIIREIVQNEKNTYELLGTSFGLRIIGFVSMFFLLLCSLFIFNVESTTRYYAIIVGLTFFFQSFSVIDFYFQAKVLSKFVVIANMLSLGLSIIIKLYLITHQYPLVYFFYSYLFDFVSLAFFLVFFYKKNKQHIRRWRFKKTTATFLLKTSWPLLFASVAIALYMRIDQVMINALLGEKAVGIFSAALRISEAWYFVPMAICASVFPAIIKAKAQSEAVYQKRLLQLFKLLVAISLAVAIPITFLSKYIIQFLFGQAYAEASGVLVITIWCGLFVSLGVANSYITIIENFQKIALWKTCFGLAANIGLNCLLIPNLGIIGAATASLIAQAIVAVIFDLFNKKTQKFFYLKIKSFLLIDFKQRI